LLVLLRAALFPNLAFCSISKLEMARATTFAARPGPFMLNCNVFSDPDQPVARNLK